MFSNADGDINASSEQFAKDTEWSRGRRENAPASTTRSAHDDISRTLNR